VTDDAKWQTHMPGPVKDNERRISVYFVLFTALVTAHSEDFVILACTVLIGLNGVTEGRSDRRTSGHG